MVSQQHYPPQYYYQPQPPPLSPSQLPPQQPKKKETGLIIAIVVIVVVVIIVIPAILYFIMVKEAKEFLKKLEEELEERTWGPATEFELKDAPVILNYTNSSQELAVIYHKGGDAINWGDIRILVSKDNDSYYPVELDTCSIKLQICSKRKETVKNSLWEAGEAVILAEAGANWNTTLYQFIYVKIMHRAIGEIMFEDSCRLE